MGSTRAIFNLYIENGGPVYSRSGDIGTIVQLAEFYHWLKTLGPIKVRDIVDLFVNFSDFKPMYIMSHGWQFSTDVINASLQPVSVAENVSTEDLIVILPDDLIAEGTEREDELCDAVERWAI